MSRLTDLIRQAKAKDPALGAELEAEFHVLSERRVFGLNFERHRPEAVQLPARPVRKGDKVQVLAPRGTTTRGDHHLWRVTSIDTVCSARVAQLALIGSVNSVTRAAPIEDLVVVAEFRDPIYPGLESTGRVERGGDKPFHTVINAENYHALHTLLYTHRGKVDAIYIDPPYNSGARDWKYNNDYVDGEDLYRHSKWLAFMERRLLLAKELLNPDESVLIVTIDEKEYLRLGLLLEQTFPEGNIQMVSSVINPAGAGRAAEFSRTDEYIFFVRLGSSRVLPDQRNEERRPVTWDTLRRSDIASRRGTAKGGRSQFFPIYVDRSTGFISAIGEPLPHDMPREKAPPMPGCVSVFPVRPDGTEMNWGLTPDPARKRLEQGYLRAGRRTANAPQEYAISYLTGGIINDIEAGNVEVTGRAEDGSVIACYVTGRLVMPTTAWNKPSHDAQRYGTEVLKSLIPGRRFPFPKAVYAVEDCLRHFLADKPSALVLDFFAGSGTTAHAVFRLNRQDGGSRQSIIVTNNEVAENEQANLRQKGLRPGDADWEIHGICDYITKPRIRAAVTGETPDGEPVKGDYKFIDEFPMAEGFDENVEFFTLTYETPWRVARHRAFDAVAPLLWMRAGSRGRRIEKLVDGWDVAETYGVLEDLDQAAAFLARIRETESVRTAFIVTEDDRRFQMVCAELPGRVEPIRLYESYLRNFEVNSGRE
ncbi:adenine-specific DNA-methyltransferase [Micromonospora violae]|uniref:Adenine-specific DNA-methyltransferase n=1 Tax=Micromonospora violae TaxID=1278207 RepID=A0A4Q7UFX6_9ACTN|nr:site-specific DNA-methyltransferase [Micromonospora violae]RZT80237.1 adenine-specific DNA-methyltransferase [Micromonospora violae]